MVYIGVDLGGTNIAVGVVDGEGRILETSECPTLASRPYPEVIRDIAGCVTDAIKKSGRTLSDVHSIGVGIPGIADQEMGMVVFCTNLGWHDIPLRAELQKYIDRPVYIDNDATVAAYAEYVAGVTKGTKSSVFLTLGTGLGAGIVLDGKPWTGAHGVATELGHVTLVAGGEECTCGKRGCAERYCSATALIRLAAEKATDASAILTACGGDKSRITAKLVFDSARAGDAEAERIVDEYADYLALECNCIISFLDPEMIALGGGVSRAGDFLLEKIRARITQYLMYKTLPYSKVVLATLGNEAGIIGAAMLGLSK